MGHIILLCDFFYNYLQLIFRFYLRKSTSGSSVWVVFLEGGWYCYDHQSCRNRWLRLRHLMTSSQWPDTRDGNIYTILYFI